MNNLFSKYHITKNDGSPVDPNAQYFVLRIDTDSAARAAVMVYAMCIEKDDPQFAEELRAWVSAQMQAVEHGVQRTGLWRCKDCGSESGVEYAVCVKCKSPRR